jgi:hypothetical protein
MFILLGPLFLIAAAGILAGFGFLLFKQTRRWSAYLLLCPFCASFLSFWLFWGAGILVESIGGSSRWSSLSAFFGYIGGFAVGGFIGFYVARKINKRLFA